MHLCPVYLRKLPWTLKFDVVPRYQQLGRFYAGPGFHDWAE
jgi:hypothetical protein